jgi:hypothetical protein
MSRRNIKKVEKYQKPEEKNARLVTSTSNCNYCESESQRAREQSKIKKIA